MTLAQIISEIQNRAGDSGLTESQITTWVNNFIKELATRTDWPWALTTYETDTTTAATQEYSLQSDFRKMYSLRVGGAGGAETEADEYSYVNYMDKNQAISDGVYAYYLNPTNDTYGLVPTPSTTGQKIYQKYYKVPTSLSAVSTTPDIPESYHTMLINSSLERYWEQEDEFDKALYYNTKVENDIERMRNDVFVDSTGDLGRMKDIRELNALNVPQKLNTTSLGK